jgi:tetratricopeptide (TPR) repeat protein
MTDADSLLAMAISQPDAAVTTATVILGRPTPDRDLSLAHHAIAIVERDRGRIAEALDHADAALRWARRAGPDREAEVRATLGTIHLFAGETAKALAQLNRAVGLSARTALPRVLHLRGCTFWMLGRYDEALRDLERSRDLSHRAGDKLWEGRALGALGDVHRARGDSASSERAYAASEAVHLEIGALVEASLASRNRALVALQHGDVVAALELLQEVDARFTAAGVHPIDQTFAHVEALLAARLAGEAKQLADRALDRRDLAPAWRADLLLASSRACLLQAEWAAAESRAREAEVIFRGHRRHRWAARSALLALEAAYQCAREGDEATDPVEVLLAQAHRVVRRLRSLADPSLPEGLLLLSQIASDAGRPAGASHALREAAEGRHRGVPLARAAGWLAEAMLAARQGDRRGLRHACRRGLDAVDEHRSLIGDLELRALASGYGLELIDLALEDAALAGDARVVLWWAERWRATALTRAAKPPQDPDLMRDIAALRDVTRRLSHDGDDHLRREQTRLEAAVRTRYRHLRAGGDTSPRLAVPALVGLLGETTLLSIVLVRRRLYAVTIADGRAELRELGDIDTVLREAEFARFALRRAAHGRRVDLGTTSARLQETLLGNPHPAWSRPAVLVAPTAALLTVPFGMMPVFRDTAVTVTPSMSLWRRAIGPADSDTPGRGHVVLVTGPDLSTGQREVMGLRRLHDDAVVLGGPEATVSGTLAALDGARLAHIAAHGTFRGDAPMFSHLMLADGPLMVHDFDRLAAPPHSIVLSACDSGGVRPIGAEEALGLVSSLLAMGTRTVVASVDPINDSATAQVMRPLHATVAAGGTLAEGLLAARRAAGDDPLLAATASAFNAWGA